MILTEQQQDFSYSQGFLEEWLKDAPAQVKGHLETLVSGLTFYRDRYTAAIQDTDTLRLQYNTLTAQSAQYLQMIQQQKELIDQQLIDSQKDLHKPEIEI
jgi:hypothetical protein